MNDKNREVEYKKYVFLIDKNKKESIYRNFSMLS